MKQFVIIGGGISGLAAANRLVELGKEKHQPIDVTVLEAGPRLGGTVHTEQREGFLIERGPDSFISEKPEALALAKRLGIESQIIETNTERRRSFIVRHGQLRPVPEGFQLLAPSRIWPFITSDIFSVAGKLRMSAELLLPRRAENGSDDESLASFVRRRLGQEALERMAQPMVGGIYTADPEILSLRATLPRFLDMERTDRSLMLGMWRRGRETKGEIGVSGARYSLFLSFERGMEELIEALAGQIAQSSEISVQLNTRVQALEPLTRDKWSIRTESGAAITAEAICLAVPSFVAASLVSNAAPELSAKLKAIKFASTATVNLGYRRDDIDHALDGFGFVVPFIEKRSLIACTFSSVKFKGRAPTDCVLLRAFVGGALQPEMFALDEDEITSRVEADLGDLLRVKGKPLFTEVTKWTNSMPQYEVGHLNRVKEIETLVSKIGGLTLAGNAYRGPGIPDCIRSGETAAESLLS